MSPRIGGIEFPWVSLVFAVASVLGAVFGVVTIFQAFTTNEVPNPPKGAEDPLANGALGSRPFSGSRPGAAVYLTTTGTLTGSWRLSGDGSSTDISFRQAAVVNLTFEEAITPSDFSGVVYQVKARDLVCLELQASAFEVSGPSRACGSLSETPASWAWSLFPKEGTSGLQAVAIALSIEPRNAVERGVAESSPHLARFISVDVHRTLLDTYTPYLTALIAAITAVVTAGVGRLYTRRRS